uniref:Rhoptry neck protein 10 n=1 Tax=Toxoplasma gondii TaxID=5811 RepID=A0A140CWX4_TOXGO|nr:rhoptry neck protein 10 [Toxoplasma gondii]
MPEVNCLGAEPAFCNPSKCIFNLRLRGASPLVSIFVLTLLVAAPKLSPQWATATTVLKDQGFHAAIHHLGNNREGRRPESSSWGFSDQSPSAPRFAAIPKSVELSSFLQTDASPSSGGIWAGVKKYVELGTSGERHVAQDDNEKKTTNGDTAQGDMPSQEGATAAEAQPQEAKESEGAFSHETTGKVETETENKSEVYRHMAQEELRSARADLVKQTNGTPEEYEETGSFPSLCGSWQTVPSSPHFSSNKEFTRYSQQNASLLEGESDTADPLPYPTCQWLPRRGIHISERRTYGFKPNVVSIERLGFHSEEGCLPKHLAKVWRYSGYWDPQSAAKDPQTKSEEIPAKLSWSRVNIKMEVNALSRSQHLAPPDARSGEPTPVEAECLGDGDRMWIPPVRHMHLDLRDTCTRPHGNFLYSQPVPPEFIITPQEIPVSHEVLAHRLKRRLRARMSILQRKHTNSPDVPRDVSLKSEAGEAIASKWTDAVDQRFATRWRDYLVQQNLWIEKVCQWHLLRESCLVPPPLAGPTPPEHHKDKGDGKKEHESQCYIPSVRHSLTRENGIDYLDVPLFPFTEDAEHVRLRKVGGCNPHLQVDLRQNKDASKLAEEQERHSADEELASVAVTSKSIHPHNHASSPGVNQGAAGGTAIPVPSVTDAKNVNTHERAENAPDAVAPEMLAQNVPTDEAGQQDAAKLGSQDEATIKPVAQQDIPVEKATSTDATESVETPVEKIGENSQEEPAAVEQPSSVEGQTEPDQQPSDEEAQKDGAENETPESTGETAETPAAEIPEQEAESAAPAVDASSSDAAGPAATEAPDQETGEANEEASSATEDSS